MQNIHIVLDPNQRKKYLENLLLMDGLSHVFENEHAAYCPISLTQCPTEVKPYVQSRQNRLMQDVLAKSGITAYDPATAPYSPDTNLHSLPNEIYVVDSAKIASARYFVGHNLLPSTGFGVELEKAKVLNRIAVIFMDAHMRISRMMPHRVIYLQYDRFETVASELVKLFALLQEYDPGLGFHNEVPALLGFHKKTGEIVDLEQLVYTQFPNLQYKYDGTVPILKLRTENSELFYENLNK